MQLEPGRAPRICQTWPGRFRAARPFSRNVVPGRCSQALQPKRGPIYATWARLPVSSAIFLPGPGKPRSGPCDSRSRAATPNVLPDAWVPLLVLKLPVDLRWWSLASSGRSPVRRSAARAIRNDKDNRLCRTGVNVGNNPKAVHDFEFWVGERGRPRSRVRQPGELGELHRQCPLGDAEASRKSDRHAGPVVCPADRERRQPPASGRWKRLQRPLPGGRRAAGGREPPGPGLITSAPAGSSTSLNGVDRRRKPEACSPAPSRSSWTPLRSVSDRFEFEWNVNIGDVERQEPGRPTRVTSYCRHHRHGLLLEPAGAMRRIRTPPGHRQVST